MSENELINVSSNNDSSPAEMMRFVLSNGGTLESLEKMLNLQERWEKNKAVKSYNQSMADFKANPPKIDKDKKVNYSTAKGKTSYTHASLFNVVDKITAELGKHGLSSSWRTAQNGTAITVTCRISHCDGHYEETSLSAVADDSGAKNAIQAVGSTITYLQRYSLLAITGLAAEDGDNDGITAEPKVDENKLAILNGLIKELSVDVAKFLQYMAVEKIEDINAADFGKAKLMLEAKRKAVK